MMLFVMASWYLQGYIQQLLCIIVLPMCQAVFTTRQTSGDEYLAHHTLRNVRGHYWAVVIQMEAYQFRVCFADDGAVTQQV